MIDPLVNPTYPQFVTVLNVLELVLFVAVAWSLYHSRHRGRIAAVMPMLALIMFTLLVSTLVSAIRVLVGPDLALGTETGDRVVRVVLIALRVFVIGGFAHVLWVLHRPHKTRKKE